MLSPRKSILAAAGLMSALIFPTKTNAEDLQVIKDPATITRILNHSWSVKEREKVVFYKIFDFIEKQVGDLLIQKVPINITPKIVALPNLRILGIKFKITINEFFSLVFSINGVIS